MLPREPSPAPGPAVILGATHARLLEGSGGGAGSKARLLLLQL